MAYRSRERVARILAHREADRVPLDAGIFHSLPLREWCDELGFGEEERQCVSEGDFKYLHFDLQGERSRFGSYLPGLPDEADVTPFGVGEVPLKSVDGYVAGKKLYHPLANVNTVPELERFPFPDVTAKRAHGHLESAVRAAKDEGFTVIGQMSQTVLETAYMMRGIDRLFLDFYERPQYVRALFEALTERRCFQARRFAQAGVDVLRIGDDIATQQGLMVGLGTYREWLKPYHARVVAAAREVSPDIPVLYHSDGKLTALLPDLIEVGVTAVNPCQPEAMPPAEVKQQFGGKLTLWGCCGTQSVYAHGSRADVLAELQMLMSKVAPGGGLVVSFINVLVTPRVLDNLRQFVECFYEVARYK
jgi:uroporphyrinogen decarboxylase